MTSTEHHDTPGPGERIGEYEVEGELGRGGHGVVLGVRDPDGTAFALKLLAGERADAVARLRREARALEALGGEHLPEVIAIDQTAEGRSYMVMERLHGETLAARMEREPSLAVEEACEIALQVCVVLSSAHRRGIVHRDLKPSNLFISHDGILKVLDFGIAKVLDADIAVEPTLTATGAMLGSPRYMAPEQIRDAKAVDPRCDIWAVGVVLHEMLSGGPCFDATTAHGLCAQIAADEPAPLPDDLPAALKRVVLRCLSKAPGERPSSAAELGRALAAFCPSSASSLDHFEAGGVSTLDATVDPPLAPSTSRRSPLGRTALVGASLLAFALLLAWIRPASTLKVATADGIRTVVSSLELPAAPKAPPVPDPSARPVPSSTVPKPPPSPAPLPSPRPHPVDDPLADRR